MITFVFPFNITFAQLITMRFSCKIFLFALLLLSGNKLLAKVDPVHYGVNLVGDSATLQKGTAALMDSFLAVQPQLAGKHTFIGITHAVSSTDRTPDFYLLLFLCLLLGLIRFSDSRYFTMLWRAFLNPTLSNRQLKDQLQGAGLSNLLMNIFFTMVGGAYIYYVVKVFTPQRSNVIPASLFLVLLIAGMMLIYISKYAVVKFSGWAFRVEGITEHYLFNVFLINKILSIILIPFIIILAFASTVWLQPVVIVSFAVIAILLINRYVRSWQVFGSFFEYSRFHFFTYLCASELLPLAVLMKLLVRGLLFY
jgi:hypothetical protein